MTLYDNGSPGDNAMPAHGGAALVLKELEPRNKADDDRSGSSDGKAGGPSERTSRNGRPIDPRPDALWHTPNREAWATVGGRHYPVQSTDFRHWLARRVYETNGESASVYKLEELVGAYAAEGLFSGPEHSVHLRTARHADVVWLDLADAEGRAVRIDKEGWRIVRAREVTPKFFRTPNMRALPDPLREGADASHLRKLLNLPDEDTFRLLLTWLSFAMVPDQPYPIIAVSGPAGAAKSSFAEVVWTTIDPNEVPLAGMPRGQDLVAYAKNNPVLCFDNLSTINAYLADDLCRLATGGGLGGRRLYTNDAEATFNARRPMVLTGINDVATRGDLADRTITVHLERISEATRRTDAEVRRMFADAHPSILAALLDMVVMGLRRRDDVRKERRKLPRMADFAEWGFAVAPAIGWTAEDFGRVYWANRNEAFAAVIEDDPIAPHILSLLQGQPEKNWQGTTEQLWTKLKVLAGDAARALNFPQSSVALGKSLRRLEPALAARGVTMERERVTAGTRISLRAKDSWPEVVPLVAALSTSTERM
jgi:putative DNA primase/helicase